MTYFFISYSQSKLFDIGMSITNTEISYSNSSTSSSSIPDTSNNQIEITTTSSSSNTIDYNRFTVTILFRGQKTFIYQEKRDKTNSGLDNTGWQVWECSNIMLRYLMNDDRIEQTLINPVNSSLINRPLLSSSSSLSQSIIPTYSLPPELLSHPNQPTTKFKDYRILDLSSGVGLIALACSKVGNSYIYTSDIPEQLPLLSLNILRNQQYIKINHHTKNDIIEIIGNDKFNNLVYHTQALSSSTSPTSSSSIIEVYSYFWGETMNKLIPCNNTDEYTIYTPESSEILSSTAVSSSSSSMHTSTTTIPPNLSLPWYDMIIISDILYIAIRDKYIDELLYTLRECTKISKSILFGFEERLIPEETAFMNCLNLGYNYQDIWNSNSIEELSRQSPPYLPLSIIELTGDIINLQKEEALQGIGGFRDTEMGDVFWEPPPIRMFIISAQK